MIADGKEDDVWSLLIFNVGKQYLSMVWKESTATLALESLRNLHISHTAARQKQLQEDFMKRLVIQHVLCCKRENKCHYSSCVLADYLSLSPSLAIEIAVKSNVRSTSDLRVLYKRYVKEAQKEEQLREVL
jgi:hypothetical protein